MGKACNRPGRAREEKLAGSLLIWWFFIRNPSSGSEWLGGLSSSLGKTSRNFRVADARSCPRLERVETNDNKWVAWGEADS